MVAMPHMRWVKFSAMRSAVSRSRTGPTASASVCPAVNRPPSLMAGFTTTAGFCAAKAAANTSMPLITPCSRATSRAVPWASAGMVVSQVMSPLGASSSSAASTALRMTWRVSMVVVLSLMTR